MNANISITNQKLCPLNVYLDNANPVIADTAVCAMASTAENKIELISDVGMLSVDIAFLKLSSVACLGIQLIAGSIKSLDVIIAFEIISKIGSKKINPIHISTKYIATLEIIATPFNFFNLAKLIFFIADKSIFFALVSLFAI